MFGRLLVADPQGTIGPNAFERRETDRALVMAVGPEGGFTATEVAQAVEAGGAC